MQLKHSLVLLLLCTMVCAEEPVYFADPHLQAAVEEALWIPEPTPNDMLTLTDLRCIRCDIVDVTGLEYATNLEVLWLRLNRITDISALAGLIHLKELSLSINEIHDLSALSGLTALEHLDLHRNFVSDLSPLSGLTNLKTLILRDNDITDVGPLAGLTGLYELHVPLNDISDLSPLSGLANLEVLHLYGCEISDISPLSGLTSLRTLLLDGNMIPDVAALSGLIFLEVLDLEDNQISDISALAELQGLKRLDLRRNPLNPQSCETHIPAIRSNNPGIKIEHPCDRWRLKLSSTPGGAVVCPGEGDFFYWDGDAVSLEALADPGFVFIGWSGGWGTTANPASLAMFQHYEIRANFISALDVVCVDDNAAHDPAPADATGSDPQENGTPEHPFDTIQEAIDVAAEGSTVFVRPGVYAENIRFSGKSITVTGIDPNGSGRAGYPVIEGRQAEPVVSFVRGADPNCLLMGFVITRGGGRLAGAMACRGSSPTVAHCLMVGNRATGRNGAAVYCTDSAVALVNCTIVDNHVSEEGAAVWLLDSDVVMTNCIVGLAGSAGILLDGDSNLAISHTNVAGGWPGPGNLDANPLFAQRGFWAAPDEPGTAVDPEYAGAVWSDGDYHLQSEAGRWYPPGESWVNDAVTSPCIDAGDPTGPVGAEPAPHAGVINMGAYGGTPQASKSKINP
ncbi:MAG: leucine-rich repeat domain-containing protein [Sedimentisphaerales bacterium]|nr:leucine-rich repeat domain-containing protein [Sedimentisphaerales bacterium]